MTVEEFHNKRKPLYLDLDTLLIRFPSSKHLHCSHAQWFSECGIPYLHTVRGYYMEGSEDSEEYIMLYSNDFEIPNMICNLFIYLFDYFPGIKWIGVGCHVGKLGEIWKPKIKVTRP